MAEKTISFINSIIISVMMILPHVVLVPFLCEDNQSIQLKLTMTTISSWIDHFSLSV